MATSMMEPARPVRVIYAKLTSTGAYDVVAHTSDIALDRARSLAERLLPGNPPLDAQIGEEVAHLRHPDGGRIVLRFARYDWADGNRGDVYVTDILWLSDADFMRARGNAFALVPRTTQVFDVTTELPPVAIEARTAEQDAQRLQELHGSAEQVKTLAANALAAAPVLIIDGGERTAAMELFALLLPPRVRSELTFQTQTFRVPAAVPRVALADRLYAGLRDGPWKVLPNVEADVPHTLAAELVSLAGDVERLALMHELYECAEYDDTDLRTAVKQLVQLRGLADALRARDLDATLLALQSTDDRGRRAGVRTMGGMFAAHDIRSALLALLQTPDGAAAVAPLLRELAVDAGAAPLMSAMADALPAAAPEALALELCAWALRAGDVPRLVALVSRDPRALAPQLNLDDAGLAPGARALALAIRETAGARNDLDATARLLQQAAVAGLTPGSVAADALHRICREAVTNALERTHATPLAVNGFLTLQEAAGSYAAAMQPAAPLPALHAVEDERAAGYPAAAQAVMAAALLTRALDAPSDSPECRQGIEAATRLLSRAGAPGRELLLRTLRERGIRDHDVAALPGAEPLADALGVNAQQAGTTRRIRDAVRAVHRQPEDGLAQLAAAVFAARRQRVRLTPRTELWGEVLGALRGPAAGSELDAAAQEVCLELLSIITAAPHLSELEDAALNGTVNVRLERLDRSIALCRAAEQENRYELLARSLEAGDAGLDSGARERLRDALGTGGLQRRLMRIVAGVVEREAP
jgi:hypothetical protein